MRRKKLLWLTVPLMACMALFFSPPIGVDAVSTTTPIDLGKKETWGADADREYITIRPCTGECEHIITGTFDASTITSNTLESIIQVEGGPHNIIFRNVNLSLNDGQNDDLHIRAFALGDTAVVNLTLEGDNVLRSAGAKSALYVPQQASLKILSKETPESTLQASSGFGSAGIGGDSNNGDCGNITINAPGVRLPLPAVVVVQELAAGLMEKPVRLSLKLELLMLPEEGESKESRQDRELELLFWVHLITRLL